MIVLTISALLMPLILVEKAFAINVALNKTVRFCSGATLPALLTDGDRKSSKNVAMKTSCWPETYVEISLGEIYQVKYVELFEGDPSPSTYVLVLTTFCHLREVVKL